MHHCQFKTIGVFKPLSVKSPVLCLSLSSVCVCVSVRAHACVRVCVCFDEVETGALTLQDGER